MAQLGRSIRMGYSGGGGYAVDGNVRKGRDQMLINGNSERIPLADCSVHCVITSPPYWGLRDYGTAGQIGLEPTPDAYVQTMVSVFREVWRVLRADGTCWLNLGDSYAAQSSGKVGTGEPYRRTTSGKLMPPQARAPVADGLKPKDLVGIPWRVALALQADGWWVRSDIIWHKPNPMPESVTDRPTSAHEYVFLLAKSARYFYDAEAVRESSVDPSGSASRYKYEFSGRDGLIMPDGDIQRIAPKGKREFDGARNRRSVWTIATESYPGAHYATFPTALVEPCLLAGTSQRGACEACGAPQARVVEREPVIIAKESNNLKLQSSAVFERGGNQAKYGQVGSVEVSTAGWRPTCDCDAPTVPAVVFDPFCGSGTVGEVCRNTGRRFIGLDLSADYLARNALPRAERKTAAASVAELPLFEGLL